MKFLSSFVVASSCAASCVDALKIPSAPCPFGGEGDGKTASKDEANRFFDGFAKAYDKTHDIKADKAQEPSTPSAHPIEVKTALVQIPAAPCPFGGEGDGKTASKDEANRFFDGFAKAYDKTHNIRADKAQEPSTPSGHPTEAKTSLLQIPAAPCPFGGEGDGKTASKEEANRFFDGFAKAYDKTHDIKAFKVQQSSTASAQPTEAKASIAEAKGTGLVQSISLRAKLQSWIQRRIQNDDAPTMAKLISSASSTPKMAAAQISVHHGEGSPDEALMPIGQGAYQSADAVAQRTTDSRKHCEDAVIYKSAHWQDCFKNAGDYIDGPSHGYASVPVRSGAVLASPKIVGLTIMTTLAATLVLRF